MYPVPSTIRIEPKGGPAFEASVLGLVAHGVWAQTAAVLPFRTQVTLTFEPATKYSLSASAEVVSVVDGAMGFELGRDASERVLSILLAWAEGRPARIEGETVPPPSPPRVRPGPASTRKAMSSKLVVVVEDEPSVARLLQLALQRRGAAVVVIGNGAEAIEFIEKQGAAAVLLDWMVPGAAGNVVLERLSKLPSPPPIAVVSGVMNVGSARQEAMSLGARAVFSKPFRVSQICEWVEENAR